MGPLHYAVCPLGGHRDAHWYLSSRRLIVDVASLIAASPEINAKSWLLKEPEGDTHWVSTGTRPASAFVSVPLQLEKKWPLPEALTSQRSAPWSTVGPVRTRDKHFSEGLGSGDVRCPCLLGAEAQTWEGMVGDLPINRSFTTEPLTKAAKHNWSVSR